MHPISAYIEAVQEVHHSGASVKETSFYPALSGLFNAIGKPLKPPVYCVSILKNVGAGFPDGGFFTKAQNQLLDKETDDGKKKSLLQNTKPERGVLEVKGAGQNLEALIQSAQVKKYLDEYGLVLVTNLWQFALVDLKNDKAREIERFALCAEEGALWNLSPTKTAEIKGEECLEFLTRCLLTGAPLKTPQDVAAFLASYARQARLRLESTELEVLDPLKKALENALGVEFKAVDKPGKKLSEKQKREQGERFFRATLVQTLFYGLFSAWLSHVKEKPSEDFRWREAQYSLHVPMVSALFEELIKATNLKSLELETLVTLAADMLNRVQADDFFAKWDSADAVQYFYEPFLERFDPVLRKELGVYYTPPEIVQYMVARVHRVLQSELGIEKGLADEQVMILDPCCGTGAFVLETLRVIGEQLKQDKPSNQVPELLKKAALERVFGFEILPAPFVVAHHGVDAVLKSFKATLKADERAPIYLTNALTGWAATPETPQFPYPGFQSEYDAAQSVKQKKKILVILGNPPYDAFAKIDEDRDLIAPYKKGLREVWKIKKWSFNDLYLRFFRIAERKLAESGTTQGVLCFISNFSYLREPSFVVMRTHLLESFDAFWLDVLNGDSRETGKRTPEGKPDPSVFSTSFNREGIKVGTSIGLMVRGKAVKKKVVSRELWGEQKREDLIASLNAPDFDAQYDEVQPAKENRFGLRPRNIGDNYAKWPLLTELCESQPFAGVAEDRKKALMSIERNLLIERMEKYFNPQVTTDELMNVHRGLAEDVARYDAKATRKKLIEQQPFNESHIVRFSMRPFDLQWCYYTTIRSLWREPRPDYSLQVWEGNQFLLTRFKQSKRDEGMPMYLTSGLCDYHCLAPNVSAFPFQLRHEVAEQETDSEGELRAKTEYINGQLRVITRTETIANLSPAARAYLAELGLGEPDNDASTAALLWLHALAIGYSRAYREEHAGGLASDWPRVPLPASADTLKDSAALGQQVAALLDMAKPMAGIESGSFRRELEPFGFLRRHDNETIEDGDEALRLSENWGFFGERGIVQPGTPRLTERAPNAEEKASLEKLALPTDTPMLDLPLNADAIWSGVPRPVWETVIGGYQVLKKWLSYRDERILSRALHLREAREVENITRRLVVLWSLGTQLDDNYQACAADTMPLSSINTD